MSISAGPQISPSNICWSIVELLQGSSLFPQQLHCSQHFYYIWSNLPIELLQNHAQAILHCSRYLRSRYQKSWRLQAVVHIQVLKHWPPWHGMTCAASLRTEMGVPKRKRVNAKKSKSGRHAFYCYLRPGQDGAFLRTKLIRVVLCIKLSSSCYNTMNFYLVQRLSFKQDEATLSRHLHALCPTVASPFLHSWPFSFSVALS